MKDKEKELKDGFYPQCYKIHLDISTVNVNNLIEELSKMSNMIFDGLVPVVYLQWGYFKKDLTDLLSKKITSEFFCEEVKPESCVGQSDLVSVFFKENYENAFAEYINQEKQKELLKIEENIRGANERLNERIREAKFFKNK
nr:MAG TPA: hypothetical protein [Caudoviricetes sp.]